MNPVEHMTGAISRKYPGGDNKDRSADKRRENKYQQYAFGYGAAACRFSPGRHGF